MKTLTKILAVLCAALFVLVLPISLVSYNIQQHFMQPEVYKTALQEQNVYQQIPDLLAIRLTRNFAQADPETAAGPGSAALIKLLQSLNQEDWRYIIDTLMPEDWAQTELESMLDDTFTFLDSQDENLDVAFSLSALKANLEGPAGMQVLNRLVEALPPCTSADLVTFLLETLTSDSPTIPVCAPPAALLGENQQNLQFLLPLAAAQIPDEITFHLTMDDFEIHNPGGFSGTSNLVLLYRQVREVFQWSLVAAIVLLVLIAVLAVRSLRELAFWWGWPLTLGSAALLVPIKFGSTQITNMLTPFILTRFPDIIPYQMDTLMEEVIRQLSGTLLQAVLGLAALFFVLGLVLLVLGLILKRNQTKTSAEAVPAEEDA